mmetsp:Transcript_18668/g.61063  ORF Transcript_18668/g.61063 Transcript_18668/m.61063 type:complete len:274 (+) Transcript_18668:1065-1886(+)
MRSCSETSSFSSSTMHNNGFLSLLPAATAKSAGLRATREASSRMRPLCWYTPCAMPPIRPRHRTRLPTAAATTLPMRPPCRLALGGPSAMSCASSCSNRRIASSPRATAARAGTVSKARCLCHGTPPTSSGLHPGGGGARFGSDTSSILCRSGAVRRRSSSMLTDGGGGCANRRCFRGSGRSGAPAATCFGSRPPFGNRTSLPAAGFSHRSQPCPLVLTHSSHPASNSACSAGIRRATADRAPQYFCALDHTRRTSAANTSAAAGSSPSSPKP